MCCRWYKSKQGVPLSKQNLTWTEHSVFSSLITLKQNAQLKKQHFGHCGKLRTNNIHEVFICKTSVKYANWFDLICPCKGKDISSWGIKHKGTRETQTLQDLNVRHWSNVPGLVLRNVNVLCTKCIYSNKICVHYGYVCCFVACFLYLSSMCL